MTVMLLEFEFEFEFPKIGGTLDFLKENLDYLIAQMHVNHYLRHIFLKNGMVISFI
ncbi:hypothetical protein [Lactococcus lactis]|uniref:hypothetical protein n=1 Tax=Lactococcus lactis TaxID=1358 RepID=UPI00223B1F7A|nr:hypothetical protein [Lactococcus lactis]